MPIGNIFSCERLKKYNIKKLLTKVDNILFSILNVD